MQAEGGRRKPTLATRPPFDHLQGSPRFLELPMRWRDSPGVPALVLAAACLAPVRAAAQPGAPDTVGIAAAVRAADSLFAVDTAARGLDGWMHWMAEDVLRPDFHGPATQGKAAVRARDSVTVFGTPGHRLAWQPTESGAFTDGRHGWTRGAWQVLDPAGTRLATGRYITIWRRTAEGWRVVMDTGVNDPPRGTPD
jgi:ketosteroid isomerase-like protein